MYIRRAENKDIPTLLDLLSEVLNIHAQLRPDIFRENTTKYREEELQTMVADNENPIYVIVKENKVLGYAFCQIRHTKFAHLMKRIKTLHIDDFCVAEEARGQHVGQTLFAFLKDEAKKLGCDDITLNCWEGNDAAKKFYEKMGLKTRSYIMELSLDK